MAAVKLRIKFLKRKPDGSQRTEDLDFTRDSLQRVESMMQKDSDHPTDEDFTFVGLVFNDGRRWWGQDMAPTSSSTISDIAGSDGPSVHADQGGRGGAFRDPSPSSETDIDGAAAR